MNDAGLTLSQKLGALNSVDLSGLRKRLDALRAQAEAGLNASGKNPSQTATESDIKQAAAQAGVSVEEFMAALERAKKMGLI